MEYALLLANWAGWLLKERGALVAACEAVKDAMEHTDLGGRVLFLRPPHVAAAVHETAWERLTSTLEDVKAGRWSEFAFSALSELRGGPHRASSPARGAVMIAWAYEPAREPAIRLKVETWRGAHHGVMPMALPAQGGVESSPEQDSTRPPDGPQAAPPHPG